MILPGETPVFFVLPIFSPVAGFFVPVDKLHVRAKKGFLTVVYEEKDNPESVRLFTRTELEKIQTVPLGYTNSVDYMAAADLLGDGWTVEVIKHIFKGLK